MKNAGKACNNRLYRHIRTFEKIIKNYFVIFMTSIIFQGHSILRVQNYRQLYLKPYSGVVLPMTEIVLSVLLHLPMMKICRSVGNSF